MDATDGLTDCRPVLLPRRIPIGSQDRESVGADPAADVARSCGPNYRVIVGLTNRRVLHVLTAVNGRLCCKSPSWTSDAQMFSRRLKWDFLCRRPEECDSSKKANQNRDSIRGGTPNVKESARRLLQQNRHGASLRVGPSITSENGKLGLRSASVEAQ